MDFVLTFEKLTTMENLPIQIKMIPEFVYPKDTFDTHFLHHYQSTHFSKYFQLNKNRDFLQVHTYTFKYIIQLKSTKNKIGL